MSYFQVATPFPGGAVLPLPDAEDGRITASRDFFYDQHGYVWSYRGVSMFLLYKRWLDGEPIDAQIAWVQSFGANTVRVLGMVGWDGFAFGPTINGNWWPQLLPFIEYLGSHGLRIEFVVFADAQKVMPNPDQQQAHLEQVIDTIGPEWNVFIEIANEPWQNGVDPEAIFEPDQHRPCPMAYGLYDIKAAQNPDGVWVGTLPVLDYLSAHLPRDPESWSRKAKDLSEYRDGSGDGTQESSPLYEGCHKAPVSDEPMGAAEKDKAAGRQRSCVPEDFFWHHGNAHINGAGSTFHCDAGLLAIVPPVDGDQQACAEAVGLAWSRIAPAYQTGHYTRGGLGDLPLVWEPQYFPEQTSRIYGRILGDLACCVAIKPNAGWVPKAANGWTIAATYGPMDSLVLLTR